MDDAVLQRFGLALVVTGGVFHLQAVAQYPQTDWATFGGFLLFVGVLATGWPLVSDSFAGEPTDEKRMDTDD